MFLPSRSKPDHRHRKTKRAEVLICPGPQVGEVMMMIRTRVLVGCAAFLGVICTAAGAWLPDLAPRHSWYGQSQAEPKLGGDHRAALRHRRAKILQHPIRAWLYRRLLYLRDELYHQLFLQPGADDRSNPRSPYHAVDRAANHRGHRNVAVDRQFHFSLGSVVTGLASSQSGPIERPRASKGQCDA